MISPADSFARRLEVAGDAGQVELTQVVVTFDEMFGKERVNFGSFLGASPEAPFRATVVKPGLLQHTRFPGLSRIESGSVPRSG